MERRDKDQGETPRKKQNGGKSPWNVRPCLAVALTAAVVVRVSLLIFFFLFRFEGVSSGPGSVIRNLYGVIWVWCRPTS